MASPMGWLAATIFLTFLFVTDLEVSTGSKMLATSWEERVRALRPDRSPPLERVLMRSSPPADRGGAGDRRSSIDLSRAIGYSGFATTWVNIRF